MFYRRDFICYENDIEWAKKFPLNYGVILTFPEGYPNNRTPKNEKVVFIDSKPGEQRKLLIDKFSKTADVIIVHDTEDGANYVYGMKEILSTFKYRLDYQPEGKPHSSCVSNYIDVTKWI